MLVFDVLWNREVVWKKGGTKRAKIYVSRQSCEVVPVPKQGGTGTPLTKPYWYRYQDK